MEKLKLKSLSKQQIYIAVAAALAVVVVLFAALRDSSMLTAPGAAIVSAVAPGPLTVVETVIAAAKERRTNAVKEHIAFIDDEAKLQKIAGAIAGAYGKKEIAEIVEHEKTGDYAAVLVKSAGAADDIFVLQRMTSGVWKIDFDASVEASQKAAAVERQKKLKAMWEKQLQR